MTSRDVVVLGGCGHVGLPLGIALADRGLSVTLYDTSHAAVETVNAARLPFLEHGAQEVLDRVVASGALDATTDAASVETADVLVVVVGTPVDEHLNPDPTAILDALEPCRPYLRSDQLIVLRSTVYPGVTAKVEQWLEELAPGVDVAFCPERIAEGRAMRELFELPQIVGARSDRAAERAEALFGKLTDGIIHTSPEEAELAKLFTNSWRYIKFAAANQFFMMANSAGVDYERVRKAMSQDYPRAADVPGAGFAAGPCLLKDTMQLSAFNDNQFVLGHAAMLVNEGLPLYLISQLERRLDVSGTTVGILGMAFKGDSDDTRSSLSYKLRRLLRFRADRVLCADPYVDDPDLVPVAELLAASDVVIVAAPHAVYRDLQVPDGTVVVDVWNLFGEGVLV